MDGLTETLHLEDQVVRESPQPPLRALGYWEGLGSDNVVLVNESARLTVTADAAATVSLDVRADADGTISETTVEAFEMSEGNTASFLIGLDALGVTDELQFAAMLEVKLHVTRNEHTRTVPLDPAYLHPVPKGFLLYGESVHEVQFGAGDFRGLLPDLDDSETNSLAHVGVARVRVLPPGQDTELD